MRWLRMGVCGGLLWSRQQLRLLRLTRRAAGPVSQLCAIAKSGDYAMTSPTPAQSVERYTIDVNGIHKVPEGYWVRTADYDALLANYREIVALWESRTDDYDEHVATIARLEADAARYRWLADVAIFPDYGDNAHKQVGWRVYEFIAPIAYGPSLDAAIDAALAQPAAAQTKGGA
jgi:hypothetical protein